MNAPAFRPPPATMNKLLLPLAIVPLCLVGIVRESQMRDRIAELEQRPQTDPAELARLSQELRDLDLELARTRQNLAEDASGACRDAKLTELEARLGASDEELAAQQQRLSSWSEAWWLRTTACSKERSLSRTGGFSQSLILPIRTRRPRK